MSADIDRQFGNVFVSRCFFVKSSCVLFAIFCFASSTPYAENGNLSPSSQLALTVQQKAALFDRLVVEIERLDGDGLIFRDTRPESWGDTVERLRKEASSATTSIDYGQVLHRLRGTYPNFHAGVSIADAYRAPWMQGDRWLPVVIRADVVKPGVSRTTLRVARVDETWANSQVANDGKPQLGDMVVAINGRPASEWLRENEIFCKQPLAEQCPMEFHRNLARGFLFWRPDSPLVVDTVRQGEKGEPVRFTIAPEVVAQLSPAVVAPTTPKFCDAAVPRPPEGFQLVWAGSMVCVFEHPKLIGTQIWRIPSFASEQSRTRDAKPGQHKTVRQETAYFYEEFWKKSAPNVKLLIIDIAGNGGGESVLAWYQLLFSKPYQSSFVRFKKVREFDNLTVRNSLFWKSNTFADFINILKRDGSFSKISEGEWLPPFPMFCPNDDATCLTEKHEPLTHGFAGRVSLIVDPLCISACVEFARNVKEQLDARIVGLPDSADTTFSRLQIHFGFDAEGQPIAAVADVTKVVSRVGSFTVAATRSTNAKGVVHSGQPLTVDRVVERRWNQDGDQWARDAISVALEPLSAR